MAAENKTRYLIMCTGRDGSTLLSALLSKSGADFGIKQIDSWNPRAGAYESWNFGKAGAHYNLFVELNPASHLSRIVKIKRRIHRIIAKFRAKRHLQHAIYSKIGTTFRLPHLTRLLGYQPKIILLYRDYKSQFASAYVRTPQNYSALSDHYFNALSTGMLCLSIYGGCVISHKEIMDANSTKWADALSDLTGINKESLIKSRTELLNKNTDPDQKQEINIPEDPRLTLLMQDLSNICNTIVDGSSLGNRT